MCFIFYSRGLVGCCSAGKLLMFDEALDSCSVLFLVTTTRVLSHNLVLYFFLAIFCSIIMMMFSF